MDVSWTVIKNQIVTKNLLPQILTVNDSFYVIVFDGPFKLECTVEKSSPDATDLQTNILPLANRSLIATAQSPFAAKNIGTKKLYKRVHGKVFAVNNGINVLDFKIPYPWIKITGVEIISAESLDRVNLYVLDDEIGTYSKTPNAQLNQFAYDLCLVKDYYEHKSEFDADLYYGMHIRIEYNSQSVKTIGLNFILNEVK
jgi:hypothetical protein